MRLGGSRVKETKPITESQISNYEAQSIKNRRVATQWFIVLIHIGEKSLSSNFRWICKNNSFLIISDEFVCPILIITWICSVLVHFFKFWNRSRIVLYHTTHWFVVFDSTTHLQSPPYQWQKSTRQISVENIAVWNAIDTQPFSNTDKWTQVLTDVENELRLHFAVDPHSILKLTYILAYTFDKSRSQYA